MAELDDIEHAHVMQSVQDMIRCPDKLYEYEDDSNWLANHLTKHGIAKTTKDAVSNYIQLDSLAKANAWLIANPERP